MKNWKKTRDNVPNVAGNIAIVFASLLLIALGGVMLFTDQVKTIYFCYGAGGCLLVWGIWLISRYFLRKEFQQTTNYGFSVGTLVVILGAVDLIRAKDIAASLSVYIGFVILVEGVVMLQNTVQLKNLRGKLWVVSLVFSLVSEAAAVVILLDVKHIISRYVDVLYVIQIAVGCFALLCLCFVGIRTKRFHKDANRDMERNLEESAQWSPEKKEEVKEDGAEETKEADSEAEETVQDDVTNS